MRWFWVDRFEIFERGKRAVALKNISVAEEHLEDPVSGMPNLHPSLIVEGFAQAGGLLISEYFGFEKRLVLAKVSKAEFHELAVQGEQLKYTVDVERDRRRWCFDPWPVSHRWPLAGEYRPVFRLSRRSISQAVVQSWGSAQLGDRCRHLRRGG